MLLEEKARSLPLRSMLFALLAIWNTPTVGQTFDCSRKPSAAGAAWDAECLQRRDPPRQQQQPGQQQQKHRETACTNYANEFAKHLREVEEPTLMLQSDLAQLAELCERAGREDVVRWATGEVRRLEKQKEEKERRAREGQAKAKAKAAPQPTLSDSLLVDVHSSLCDEHFNQRQVLTTLNCGTLWLEAKEFRTNIRVNVRNICKDIQPQCDGPLSDIMRGLSTRLRCGELGGYFCPTTP